MGHRRGRLTRATAAIEITTKASSRPRIHRSGIARNQGEPKRDTGYTTAATISAVRFTVDVVRETAKTRPLGAA
jgi:hypothetical protein